MFWKKKEPGWLARESAEMTRTVVPAGNVKIKEVREDRPSFKREYEVPVDHRVVKITARSSAGLGRWYSGELTQPGGRWVLFDPERIADKILDPALVPLVEVACRDILSIDRAFMASRPNSFVDEGGSTWVRQP